MGLYAIAAIPKGEVPPTEENISNANQDEDDVDRGGDNLETKSDSTRGGIVSLGTGMFPPPNT